MARPVWRGSISFGLVSVPVQLFTAVRQHRVRFKQLHRETRAPVRQKRVDSSTGEEVQYRDVVKGYEVSDGRYVVVEPEELEELDPEASRLIDIRDYVEQDEIDPIYFDRPYYLAPDGEIAGKPYRLLAEAMQRTGKVAIASFVMRNQAYLAAIRARDGMLLLSTMHYDDEVADPAELDLGSGADATVGDREVQMAEELIRSLLTGFDPASYCDEHRERLLEFLEAKADGEQFELAAPDSEPGNVVDLLAALERSLDQGQQERSDTGSDAREPDDYAAMSRSELYELAKDRDVPGRSSLSKPELMEALRATDRSAGAA